MATEAPQVGRDPTDDMHTIWHCPDDGWCHHRCQKACFRVLSCEPLSDVFPNDEWPESIRALHRLLNKR
jgi:hypothetical protein